MSDIPDAARRFVYERDKQRCRWCGRSNIALHVHHITYRSAGGLHEHDNLILLCYLCHSMVHSNKNYYPSLLQELLGSPGVTGFQLVRRKNRASASSATSVARWRR